MPRPISAALAGMLVAALAACSGSGASASHGETPSTLPCGSSGPPAAPACLPPGSPGASDGASAAESAGPASSFEVGPSGTPIGEWSLTLTGGPASGTYSGTDEMVCTTLEDGPTSVVSNPVGSPPIGHIAMVTGTGADDSIVISAGGIEGGGNYQTDGPAQTLDGPTVSDGVLHLEMTGTQHLSDQTRTLLLEATCPLFPAETDG